MPLLELRDITKDFPGVRALDGVSFTLEKGEIHALCGENGAGKSTLIKTLCGVNPWGTYGGEILLDGAPVRFQSLKDAEHHGIALIAQELALVPELSVMENLALGREPVRGGLIRWDVVRKDAETALELVGLDVDPGRAIKELGIGQQQLVEIGKALAKKARILVLDEPTAALTESDTARLMRLLVELRASGVSLIYISHRLEEVFQIADRVTVLRDGRSVGGAPVREMTTEKVIAMMVGREVGTLYPRPPHKPGVPLLKIENWTVEDPLVPGRQVLRNVSLEVREREIVGIGGLMGAGRTALVSSLFGAARSRVTGTLSLHGGPPRKPFTSPPEAIAAGLALVSEDRKRYGLVLPASIRDNMTLASLRRFVHRLFLSHSERDARSEEQFRSLRVRAPGLASLVNTLSGGNQQKVVLGKWLIAAPRVLLLDEPTRGIDVGAKAEIYELVNRLAAAGLGVVMVSSDLPELLGLSHRVIVMNKGEIAAELHGASATAAAVMSAATAQSAKRIA
jgi:D-xylose transport system ATP-binding protein